MLALSLLSSSQLQESNLDKAKSYFFPKPGQFLELDSNQLLYQRSTAPAKLWGEIEIRPPADTCLRIQTDPSLRDQNICRLTRQKFFVKNIDENGELQFKLFLNDHDEAVRISWPSHYRRGVIRPLGDESGPDRSVWVKDCQLSVEAQGRRIHLNLLGGSMLELVLPVQGAEKSYEREVANLLEATYRGQVFSQIKAKHKGTYAWDIKGNTVMLLPADRVFYQRANTPGQYGECRYTDRGYGPKQNHGLIECHQGATFHYLKLPLTCLTRNEL